MSLVGNLEDLGLGDILQIVSLSRKSGELVLQNQHRIGKIIFKNGQVIRATSTDFRENLGDLLIRYGVIDLERIKSAVALQRTITPPPRIGVILTEHFGVSRELIETLVKEQIETIVYSFFAWHEGTFVFDLGDSGEVETTSFDPLQFMLDQGLSPQWLAMEGSRILDEKLHRGEALDVVGGEPVLDVEGMFEPLADESPPVAPVAEALQPTLILVDDDDVTRKGLAEEFGAHGFNTVPCASADEFLAAVEEARRRGCVPQLLVDLLMPRQDGSGILGGLELIERIRGAYPELKVLAMSDHPHAETQGRMAELGVRNILRKPGKIAVRSTAGTEQLSEFGESVRNAFATIESSALSGEKGTFNLGAELRVEFGEQADQQRSDRGPETPGLYLLRGMLQELNNPSLGGGIILLVLRFASELMNRAVIFLVKEDEIVGLGQFGLEAIDGISADVRVRRMRIPRNAGSVLEEALHSWSPLKTVTGPDRWDQYLVEELGGGVAREIFLGPIISEGKVVALLYGDNAPHDRAIGETESLEIFLSQAGLAMEKALLERRLRSREMLV